MKNYTILLFLLLLATTELYGLRRAQAVPQTRAEQLMRNYTPKPYPQGYNNRGYARSRRYYNRPVAYYDAAYYPYSDASTDDYAYGSGATNEPEHLGID